MGLPLCTHIITAHPNAQRTDALGRCIANIKKGRHMMQLLHATIKR